ncbi:hypothetical protein BGW39_002999 [Mortierella sp. 14UC]|nr:hypothetical protein BGW39_002999 [Mortierella sp. 14UC]
MFSTAPTATPPPQVDKIQSESEHLLLGVNKLHIDLHYNSDHDAVVLLTFAAKLDRASLFAEKPILTTHPDQPGVKPYTMKWGDADPQVRGPIVVSHHPSSMNIWNALRAYGGPYSVYRALAVTMEELAEDHRPNFGHTQPVINIPQQSQWSDPTKIVSMDPFGHLTSQYYAKEIDQGLDIRPTIAITRAHMLVPEIHAEVKSGSLAREYRSMYPELITRPDIKVFLPPIGGLTVYIFGNRELISDRGTRWTIRVHDECNGSDVFCYDICTSRPYLIYGMIEAIKETQNSGVGLIVYFRKEGRALGEVTKYLVYNARKRESDSASKHFERTENVAGVKDMRFQGLMPDVLHWLRITKIDRFMSMSSMKHDAIIDAGIQIMGRVPIPDELIPTDSKVETDAKVAAEYYTNGRIPDAEDLSRTVGRGWDDSPS